MATKQGRTPAANHGYRTVAEQLRAWPDDRITRLLAARPDLATPAPQDSSQLAARAATRSSVMRALDQLTLLELSSLDALVVAGQTTLEQLIPLVHADPSSVRDAVDRLLDLALAWQSSAGLRPLTGVVEALGRQASGVRPMVGSPLLAQALDELSAPARALLEHVDAHGGEATAGSARRQVSLADAASPAEELIARGLLVPTSGGRVQVPGEVGLALRGGRTTLEPVDRPPALALTERDPALVDRTGAGAAFEAVTQVEVLLDHWGSAPPLELRSGGLAVRDLKAAAALLQIDPQSAGLVVEVVFAARLCATRADADGRPVFVPTDAFDSWRDSPAAERWAVLARAWLASPRLPSLAGTKDPGGKTRNALDPESASLWAAETRSMALAELAATEPGAALAAGTGVPSMAERLAWLRPRRPVSRAAQVEWALAEAGHLGVTGAGALPTYSRLLVADEDPVPTLAALMPAPVDHVMVQADLTAVAPGPLEPALARQLHLLAEVESRGGASVHRFTSDSLRRAMDAGWSAAEVHAFVASISRTPVPQPLTYLIDDTARRFGTIRVGHAEAFLRADDETALSELMHHPKAATLGLRRLAPTVLVSSTPLDVLLPRLRELGAAPAVEGADGSVLVTRPDQLRARTPRTTESLTDARRVASLTKVVAAIRTGDRVAESRASSPERPAGGSGMTPAGALAALRQAIETGEAVVIGYVDNHGGHSHRLVRPRSVDGGQLTALDVRSDDLRSFAVHRITAVSSVESRG